MDNETLTRILSARFITCNEQARKGSKVSSFVHNDRIVKVTIDGKTYETSWANVVLVEE